MLRYLNTQFDPGKGVFICMKGIQFAALSRNFKEPLELDSKTAPSGDRAILGNVIFWNL